jgi:hypothetical protein
MKSFASEQPKRFTMPCLVPVKTLSRVAALSATLVVLSASFCGPELTTPSSVNVSGTWFGAGPAAGLSNITMVLTQAADGYLGGTFTATGTSGPQVCPATGTCTLSSTINGANTVLQVNLVLTDAGTFTGQIVTPTHIRGTMASSYGAIIEFDRIATP